MTAQIIDGRGLAQQIRDEVAEDVSRLVAAGRSRPGLATVLVGQNPASKVYVGSKQKACAQAGIESFGYNLPINTSQKEIEELISQLNADRRVNGILVQLPLPTGLDEEQVLNAIRIEKDVDGFHPLNIGRLAQKGRDPLFVPCMSAGVMMVLERTGMNLEGANAVVLGRSSIVGMPVALLLVRKNATVTICHSRSRDLAGLVRKADVLVVAVGLPEMVRGDWIKPGAVVVDVGVNRVEAPERPKGYRLTGDVCFEEAKEVAGFLTPVPGGVGPMAISILLKNTVRAAKLAGS